MWKSDFVIAERPVSQACRLRLSHGTSATQAPRFGLVATAEIALNDPSSTPGTNSARLTSDRFTLVAK